MTEGKTKARKGKSKKDKEVASAGPSALNMLAGPFNLTGMKMVQVTDLGGTPHLINPEAIVDFYFNSFLTPPGKCTILYGSRPLNIREDVPAVVALLTNHIHIVSFNIPPGGPGMAGGFPIYINVSAIAGVQPVPGGAALTVSGASARIVVLESAQDVLDAIAAARNPPRPIGAAV